MYKSKLQELCHKKQWALPNYTSMRDGPDHCPRFQASVVVSGLSFDTPNVSKSSKEAYNEAARVAFLHFSSGSDQTNAHVEQQNIKKQVENSQDLEVKKHDFAEEFKRKLQICVQEKKLDSPVYGSAKESPNASHFRGKVSIGVDSFESEELYNTVEEADAAAAQAALLSLETDALHENKDPNSYKNLLQELGEEEGIFLPKYTTIRSGGPNCSTFSSIVEVEGEIFEGVPAKSRKVAELNAAKAAYTIFIERKIFQTGYFSPRSSDDGIQKLAPRLGSLTVSEDHQSPMNPPPSDLTSIKPGEQIIGKNEAISRHHTNKEPDIGSKMHKPAGIENPGTDPLSSLDSSTKNSSEMKCYLLCNRFKVFNGIPDVSLPKGTVVLPISENKWTVVSLEFPNEKCV